MRSRRFTGRYWALVCAITIIGCSDDTSGGGGGTDVAQAVDSAADDGLINDSATADVGVADTQEADSAAADATDVAEDVTETDDAGASDASDTSAEDAASDAAEDAADDASDAMDDAQAGSDAMPPSADVVGPGAGDAADTKSSSPGAVRVSPSLVETSEFGGTFEVFCEALDAQGQKLKDPGDWQIDFSPHQPMKMGEIFASAKSGTLTVTCSSLQANVKVSTELEVASEGLDPAVPGLAKKLLTAVDKVNFVLNKPTDEVNQAESIKELKAMLTKWDAGFVASKQGLLDVGQKLPTLAQVKAAGIPASADDGPWVTQLNKVQKLADGVIDLLKKTPSTALTDQTYKDILAAVKTLQKEEAVLAKLKPSATVIFEHRAKVDLLAMQTLPSLTMIHTQLVTDVLDEVKEKECNGCFSIAGLAASVAVQYALDAVPTYNKLLKDAGWAIGQMTVMLTIQKFVDSKFKGGSGPQIDSVVALGQGVVPGNKLSVMGSGFGSAPGECGVIFLTPALSASVIDSLKIAAKGIPSVSQIKAKTAWQAAKIVKDAIDQFIGTAKLLTGLPETLANGVVIMPSQPKSQLGSGLAVMELGVVPKKAHCKSGLIAIPQPGILIPTCKTTGTGKSHSVLVIAVNC